MGKGLLFGVIEGSKADCGDSHMTDYTKRPLNCTSNTAVKETISTR